MADRLIRWGAAVSVCTVTAIAAVISYTHTHEMVVRHGKSGAAAMALPLTVDGLIATCSLVLLDHARRHKHRPWHAWALLALGVAATVGANIAHGLDHGPIGALVAGWPALVAVGSFELLTRLLHNPPNNPACSSPPGAREHAPDRSSDGRRECGEQEPAVAQARQHFAEELAAGRLPSVRALKRELQLGHTRAAHVHDQLTRRP
jgi:hypothetical protein